MKPLCILLNVLAATTYAINLPIDELPVQVKEAFMENSLDFDASELGKHIKGKTDKFSTRRTQDDHCTLCARFNTSIVPDIIPSSRNPDNKTCESWSKTISKNSFECAFNLPYLEQRCCDFSGFPDPHECATAVRSEILNDSYDTNVPPIPSNGTRRVLDIKFRFTFIGVKSLDVKTSLLETFVAVTMEWNDPRLAWTWNKTNCVISVPMRASESVEETDIWVPSLDLGNRATSLQDLPLSNAIVQADGTVEWTRTGTLSAICTFVGLKRMPFDDLGCRLIFSDYTNGYSIDYTFMQNNSSEQTPGLNFYDGFTINFSEFKVIKDKARIDYLDTDKFQYDWANHFFVELYFNRAQSHYVFFSIFPSIIFTIMSFGQYSISVTSGERLSFSVTVVLISVTHSIVTAEYLPICSEMLWLNIFNFVTMLFTLCGIVETLLILWYYTVKERMIQEENEKKKRMESSNSDREHDSLISGLDFNDDQNSDMNKNDELDSMVSDGEDEEKNEEDTRSKNESIERKNVGMWRHSLKQTYEIFTKKVEGPRGFVDRIDRLVLIILPISYLIFFIIMFAGVLLWEVEPK